MILVALSHKGAKHALTVPSALKLESVKYIFFIFLDKRLVMLETIRRRQPKCPNIYILINVCLSKLLGSI